MNSCSNCKMCYFNHWQNNFKPNIPSRCFGLLHESRRPVQISTFAEWNDQLQEIEILNPLLDEHIYKIIFITKCNKSEKMEHLNIIYSNKLTDKLMYEIDEKFGENKKTIYVAIEVDSI